jgi:hypothetical protein
MLASPRTEPVAKAQELGLVDWPQDGDHSGLDDFILQGGDAERPLSAIGLRDEPSPRGQRSMRSSVDPLMEISEVALEVRRVVGSCQPVDPRCSVLPRLKNAHSNGRLLVDICGACSSPEV